EVLTEFINPYNVNSQHMYSDLAQMGMNDIQSAAFLAKSITDQGLIISANEIFWLSAGIFILLMVIIWFAKPPFGAGAKSDGGGAH
ncbi:MFS transporter, partial [Providencia rettgeri]